MSKNSLSKISEHTIEENIEMEEKSLFYLFTLDSLNFCFWPLANFEYENLIESVQNYIYKKGSLETLSKITAEELKNDFFKGVEFPLAEERAKILREMANTMLSLFKGSFKGLIAEANKSAVELLNILTANFLNFQDHSVYKGHQIHFYKRAQILIRDIYAKFNGKGCGEFKDIDQLTMFPDYRVPQILNELKVLEYSEELSKLIQSKTEIDSNSEMEIEIRASTVIAVEKIKEELNKNGVKVSSIQIDYYLWRFGEDRLGKIVDHHRTWTIYY